MSFFKIIYFILYLGGCETTWDICTFKKKITLDYYLRAKKMTKNVET